MCLLSTEKIKFLTQIPLIRHCVKVYIRPVLGRDRDCDCSNQQLMTFSSCSKRVGSANVCNSLLIITIEGARCTAFWEAEITQNLRY